jgi:hypothetical protein
MTEKREYSSPFPSSILEEKRKRKKKKVKKEADN